MYKPQTLANWLLESFQGYNTELPFTEAKLTDALAIITDDADLDELGISFFESINDFLQTQGPEYFAYVPNFKDLSHEEQLEYAEQEIVSDPTMFFLTDGHILNFATDDVMIEMMN